MPNQPLVKRAFSSTIAGGILFLISFGQAIVIVPILLKHWGQEKYGIWIAIWAFVLLMRTFDTGHLNFIGNEYLRLFFTDKTQARKILSSGVQIAVLLGAGEIVFYLLLITFGLINNVIGVPGHEVAIRYSILISLVPWALSGSFVSVILRAIPAFGKYTQMIYFSVIMKIGELVVLVWGGLTQQSIVVISVWMATATMLYVLSIIVYTRKLMGEQFPRWSEGSWKQGFRNLVKSLSLTLNSIMEQYLSSGVILLISRSLSIAAVPLFSTVRTVTNTAVQVTSLIVDPLTPDLVRFYSIGEFEKIKQIFVTNWFLMAFVINLPLIAIMPFLERLYVIWTAGKITFDIKLYVCLALSVSVSNFGRPFLVIIRTLNKLTALNLITGMRLLLVFGLTIPFLEIVGLWTVGLAFLVSEIVCSIIIPIYFFHKIFFSIHRIDYMRGIMPTIILTGFFLFSAWFPNDAIYIALIFFALQVFYSLYSWFGLPIDVRLRLSQLLPKRLFNA